MSDRYCPFNMEDVGVYTTVIPIVEFHGTTIRKLMSEEDHQKAQIQRRIQTMNGKKTYIGIGIAVLAIFYRAFGGEISPEVFEGMVALGGGIALVGFRHAITKIAK